MKIALVVLALIFTVPAYADRVIGIADGDTLTVLHDRKLLRIRLADIDAPEKAQAFGQTSKQSLSDLCFGRDATYQSQTIDKYGRTVARVTCAGIDVNRVQVERGLAWVYAQYNKDGSLPSMQAVARSSRKGLWADKAPMPPWEFRHPVKGQQSTHQDAECRTGPRGGRFMVVNGRKRYGC